MKILLATLVAVALLGAAALLRARRRRPRAVRQMTDQEFYRQLFEPLERTIGPLDPLTIVAIIGFDAGGPLNFCTISGPRPEHFTTYVTCELAVREEQVPSAFGRYELLACCDDEGWVRKQITNVGRMSLEMPLGHHHTMDIGSCVSADEAIQGLVFEKVYSTQVGGADYGVLRCIGITRPEMEFALQNDAASLLARLKDAGVYPRTAIHRQTAL